MSKNPGPSAQIWCHTPLTHWICTGYRFDLQAGTKVEGLCTCACHQAGATGIRGKSYVENMIYDLVRFEQAELYSSSQGIIVKIATSEEPPADPSSL